MISGYIIITRTVFNVKGEIRKSSYSSLGVEDHHHYEFDIRAQYESQSIIIRCARVAAY